MGRKEKYNTSISKSEQVFRRLFSPKVGDFVEFTKQYEHKHRRFKGYVQEVRENKKGIKTYIVGITSCEPLPRWGKPDKIFIKGNQGIEILKHSWYEDVEKSILE